MYCACVLAVWGEPALFILLQSHRLFLFLATIIEAGSMGAFWRSSSVPSFGCVPGNIFDICKI